MWIKMGMLVVVCNTDITQMQWDPHWLPGYELGITEQPVAMRKWRVRTSQNSYYASFPEDHLVPLVEIPPEDRGLRPREALQKYRNDVIDNLFGMSPIERMPL